MGRSLPAKTLIAATIATAAVLPTKEAGASTQVYTYSTNAGTIRTFNDTPALGDHVVGIRLTAGTAVTVKSLGFIDIKDNPVNNYNDWYHGSNPADTIHDWYQMGIWLNDGTTSTLLGTATATQTSVLIDGFRYSPIHDPLTNQLTSVTIPAGKDFTLAVLLPANPLDAWLYGSTHTNSLYNPPFSSSPWTVIGAGSGRGIDSSTLIMPTSFTGLGVYSIVNGSDQQTPEAPEPASAIFVVSGAAVLLLRRRPRSSTE